MLLPKDYSSVVFFTDMKHIGRPLFWILIASPFLLWAICLLLPVHDDWTYFTTPYYDFGPYFKNRLLPWGGYWRPWDGLFGYVLSLCPTLFPTLNHVVVFTGHIANMLAVYFICRNLGFKQFACNIAAVFFFISPATLGTVLGIDSMNQTYSSLWGLLATLFYIKGQNVGNVTAWLICASIAVLSKENGITFFVIPQLLAWGFGKVTLRRAVKDTSIAIFVVIVYFAAHALLDNGVDEVNEEYLDFSLGRKLKNFGVFIGMTWIPLDYVSLFYKPSRNVWVVTATLAASMPFLLYMIWHRPKALSGKRSLCIILCILAAASPHLATIFSAMHPYAGLGMAAVLVAHLADGMENRQLLHRLFVIFCVSCIFVDCHHWLKAYESGITGNGIAEYILEHTKNPPLKVRIINIDNGEKKYSSFCVIPYEAFGWGLSVRYKNGQKWPKEMSDTTIVAQDKKGIGDATKKAFDDGCDAVWKINGTKVYILNNNERERHADR